MSDNKAPSIPTPIFTPGHLPVGGYPVHRSEVFRGTDGRLYSEDGYEVAEAPYEVTPAHPDHPDYQPGYLDSEGPNGPFGLATQRSEPGYPHA